MRLKKHQLRNLIRKSLVREQSEAGGASEIEYAASCQYEIDINATLNSAGIGAAPPPPPNPNFCFGTDTGGDAQFWAYDPTINQEKIFNLEVKGLGGGGKEKLTKVSHPEFGPVAVEMLESFLSKNTVGFLQDAVKKDFEALKLGVSKSAGKGLQLFLPPDVSMSQVTLPDDSARKIAELIYQKQAEAIEGFISGAEQGVTLYYFFARVKQAFGIGIQIPLDLSQPTDRLMGTLTAAYQKSDTFYIQIQQAGMFHLGQDPLGLEEKIGCSPFEGTVETSGRFRFKASSGKSPVVSGRSIIVNIDENPVEVKFAVNGRRFYFYAREDIKVKGTTSDFDLDNPGSGAMLAQAVSSPVIEETIKRILSESKSKDSGTIYEETLDRGFNESGPLYCDIVRGKYDLELTIKKELGDTFILRGQPKANVEVKYGWGAQLGKFDKKHWSSFTYDKTNGFVGVLADTKDYSTSEWQPVISELLMRLNASDVARKNTDAVVDYIKSIDNDFSGILDLTKKFEAQSPLVTSWPAKNDDSYRQKEVGTDVTIPPLFKLLQWKEKGVNYVIISPRGNPGDFRGWIGLVGSAPSGFNPHMRQMTPGPDLKANIRWVNKGGKSGHTFSLDCKFAEDTERLIGEGMSFASPEDVGYLLVPDYVVSSADDIMDREDLTMTSFEDINPDERQHLGLEGRRYLRALIREALILEELTKTDKKEIERIARKQAQKEIERVVGRDFSKSIEKEVQKTLKGKATKQEIAEISKSVIKKLYKQLSVNTPQIVDRIKV